MALVKIRAIVHGYQGDMLCLFAAMDEASGMVLIDRGERFDEEMEFPSELTILTNISVIPTWTMFFKEAQLKEAIDAYHTLSANDLLALESNAQRYDPGAAIQFNGVKESGTEFRFSENLNNGQVGVLMCALFAEKQRKIRASLAAQTQVIHLHSRLPHEKKQQFIAEPVSVGFFF